MSMNDLKREAKAAAAAKLARMASTFGHDSEVTAAKAAKPPAMKSGKSFQTTPIEGGTSRRRLDRTNYKKGGRATEVNIFVEPQGNQTPAVPPMAGPMPPHPPMAGPAPMPPRPMPPPPGAAMPPNMGPRAPMPMRKEGGRTDYDAGAGSGRGRLEKAAKYGNKT